MHKLIPKYETAGVINLAFLNSLINAVSKLKYVSTVALPDPLDKKVTDKITPKRPKYDIEGSIDDKSIENDTNYAEKMLKKKAQEKEDPDTDQLEEETNYQDILKGYGIQMIGRQLGESIDGDLGDILGQTVGNLGSIIGNGQPLKDFLKPSNLGNLSASIGTNILDRHTSHNRYNGKYGDLSGGIDLVAGLIGSNPYASFGMAAINKATGGTDGMTAQDALLGSNALAGALFSVNPALGAAYMGISALNSATGKTTQKFKGNDLLSQEARAALGGSYSKTEGDLNAAQSKSNKKYGGISRFTGQYQKANGIVEKGNNYMAGLNTIYGGRQLGLIRGQKMADINSLDYRLNTFGGYDLYGTVIGRKGMKLPTTNDINRVRDLLKFKKGGQMNVIPEGALHARLHHMETENKITKKGIPVIDKHGEQQAEIERNEIIFSLEVTNKLEELRKDGSDKAALEAGKLLVDEIFHNTDDRTGLIQEVIGTDEAKKGVFKEGGIIAEMPNFAIQAEEPEIEKFQDGGIIAEEPEMDSDEDKPVGIEEVEYFQTGGIIAEMPDGFDDEEDEVEEYLKGNKVKKVKSNQAYYDKDSNTVYYTNKESKKHEMFHAEPDLELIEYLRPYWENLDDNKITELGGSLEFLKRFNDDPGYFFSPEELAARISTAYELIKDLDYTDPNFFKSLTLDELKYGDNMRDLTYMFSPENLAKIFKGYYYDLPNRYNGPISSSLTYDKNANEYISSNWSDDKKGRKAEKEWYKSVPEFAKHYAMIIGQDGEPIKYVSHEKLRKGSPYNKGEYEWSSGPVSLGGENGEVMLPNGEFAIPTDEFDPKSGGRFYVTDTDKYVFKAGGIIEQLNKLSPDKLKELENILKYLSHD